MPDPDDIPRRRRVLVLYVTQAAGEVSRLVHEAHDLNLPVEPGSATAATLSRAGPSCSTRSFPKPASHR